VFRSTFLKGEKSMMKRSVRWVWLSLFITIFVSGCDIFFPISTHRLEVVNLCAGPNTTVNFYLDGSFQGQVTLRRSFTLLEGQYALYAEGIGTGGATFSRSAYVDRDLQWTLCPGAGLLDSQQNQLETNNLSEILQEVQP
jgi:hypothetical protein